MANNPPENVLSADYLSNVMLHSLPQSIQSQIRNPYDAIALACHAGMLAAGFRLRGLGEDHRIENPSDSSEPQPLPEEWNTHSGSYAFRYAHTQSSMEYLLKVNRMGSKIVVIGMGMGDDKPAQFDLRASEFVSEGNLPSSPKSNDISEADGKTKLKEVFINVGRLSDLGSLLRVRLIQKLMPSLHKEGYEEDRQEHSSSRRQRGDDNRDPQRPDYDPLRDDRGPRPAQPHPFYDPLAAGPVGRPGRPLPEPIPGFEDEHQLHPRRPIGGAPGFPNLGERDLYPQGLGPNDPLRGGIGPGLGGGFGGGGMHPTFDDPLFGGQGGRAGRYNPQAPPGSRYDPPGTGEPWDGGHPRGAGMGGRPPNPFGGFGGNDFI